MLTKVRIEVEELTVGEAVEALTKYEHAIQVAEAQRYERQWPHQYESYPDPLRPEVSLTREIDPLNLESDWSMKTEERQFYDEELGRELLEEVLEYDATLPGWKGRRVVRFARLDGRENAFAPLELVHPAPTSGIYYSSFSVGQGPFIPDIGDDPSAPQNGDDLSAPNTQEEDFTSFATGVISERIHLPGPDQS